MNESIIGQWRNGKAHEQAAALIWSKFVQGKEPGTTLPTINHLRLRTGRSLSVVSEAKRLLGEHGALRKENRQWVVAEASQGTSN